jgi:alpha-tubulin suppressor-like RCC1 family protein
MAKTTHKRVTRKTKTRSSTRKSQPKPRPLPPDYVAIWAWGKNDHGQLGVGTAIAIGKSAYTPCRVANLPTVIDPYGWLSPVKQRNTHYTPVGLAAGTSHSLAVDSDGRVWAWGSNDSGQIGDGTGDERIEPVALGLDRINAVAAGESFSAAVNETGSVWTWGSNDYGTLGRGASEPYCYAPKWLPSIRRVRQLACGQHHVVAVKEAGSTSLQGTVWAWGSNTAGQTGNGDVRIKRVYEPSLVLHEDRTVLRFVRAVAAGGDHSLALGDAPNPADPLLSKSGLVWAWGRNDHGQLGDGTKDHRSRAVAVRDRFGNPLENIVAIAAGQSHSLALKDDGTVWAWGSNRWG